MVPVEIEDAALAQQVVVALGVRERRKNGKLGQVKVDFAQEINQLLDVVFGLVIEAEEDGTLHTNPIVMVAFYALLDVVGSVVNGLIHIPSTRFGGQIKYFGVIFNGMANPFLLQRRNGTEEIHFPLFILCQ